jgi:galacturan 1,4-alpha-galacturonidase
MRITDLLACALLQASTALSSSLEGSVAASNRPFHPAYPYHPSRTFVGSPARTKTCTLKALGGGKDDSANILNAIKKCNNGGHVVFPKDQQFTIGTALDLTFLNSVDLGLSTL